MRKVAVIGQGMTKFGQAWNKDAIDLGVEANLAALNDAGIDAKDIQSMYLGNMSGGVFSKQEHLAAAIADFSGFKGIPATRVEAACASGGVSFRSAYLDVAAGNNDLVIASGVEKMYDIGGLAVTKALAMAASTDWEGMFGATFPGLYALIAKRHMYKYGTTNEQLAMCSVKNHKNAINNPFAQFRKEISVDDVLKSTKVADPLRLLDCSPITDGAASVILASEEMAKKITDSPVWIAASAHATDSISLHDREDITTLQASVRAAKAAFAMSKLVPKDIGSLEVHDCFSIAEICAIEDLGFTKKGLGGEFTEQGNTEIGGRIPVNTSGGLKAKGHPIGATGIAQIIEAVKQLRGEAVNNTDADYAMTHNVGGSGGTAVCHILKR